MKIQLCFFLLSVLIGNQVDSKDIESDNLVEAVIGAYNKAKFYEDKYYKTGSDLDLASVVKYNDLACKLLSKHGASDLTTSDLKTIARRTGLKILHSQNDSIKILSWSIFTSSPEPDYFNFLVGKYSSIHLNRKVDIDVELDSIVTIRSDSNLAYLLLGSKKCGSLCITNSAFLFTLSNSNFLACEKAFVLDNQYFDVLCFNYTLSEDLKDFPTFKVNHNSIIIPEFSEDRSKIIGARAYKIASCRTYGE